MTTTNRTRDYSGDVSIPRGTVHLTSDFVYAMCQVREGSAEITDSAAAAIAAWYQSPRGPGATFAALVSHFPVTVADLEDAISYELSQMPAGATVDRLALGMLATWAMNGPGL